MERLNNRSIVRSVGVSIDGIRKWGMLFLLASIIGVGIVQRKILGIRADDANDLLTLANSDMIMHTAAMLLEICGACAVCVYTFLLVEGVQKTSNLKNYFVRILTVALLSEIPYDLVFNGKWLSFSSCNPAFGLAICMCMLWFYKIFPGFKLKNVLYKVAATLAALLWCNMLSFEHNEGSCMVIIGLVLWVFQRRPQMRIYAAIMAALTCSIFSLYFMVAPVVFLLLHFYNGEKGKPNMVMNHLSYPMMLIVVALIGMIAF